MADLDQIQQVFINLIINASEAMTKGGKLDIESKLDKTGEYLEVIFKDNGPGIPNHIKARIFDPFYTTKEQEQD
jgi:two-component system NtrC family sensor kinase